MAVRVGAHTGPVGWCCPRGNGGEDVEHELKCHSGLFVKALLQEGSYFEFC
jgi:hypothetical protein